MIYNSTMYLFPNCSVNYLGKKKGLLNVISSSNIFKVNIYIFAIGCSLVREDRQMEQACRSIIGIFHWNGGVVTSDCLPQVFGVDKCMKTKSLCYCSLYSPLLGVGLGERGSALSPHFRGPCNCQLQQNCTNP